MSMIRAKKLKWRRVDDCYYAEPMEFQEFGISRGEREWLLTSQYGLKKLLEHIWMLIGMAAACENMGELRRKMAERFGRIPVQLTLFLPPSDKDSN